MNLWISALYTSITCGSLVTIEILKRRHNISAEYTRRISHCIIGTMGILGYLLGPLWLYAIVTGALTIVLIILRQKNTLTSVTKVKRKSYGDIFLPLGLLATIPLTINHPANYVASILIMTFADSLCGIMSDLRKKQQHTISGSLVFTLTTFIILAIFTEIAWHNLLWISILIATIEYFSKVGSDNLTIPIATSIILLIF